VIFSNIISDWNETDHVAYWGSISNSGLYGFPVIETEAGIPVLDQAFSAICSDKIDYQGDLVWFYTVFHSVGLSGNIRFAWSEDGGASWGTETVVSDADYIANSNAIVYGTTNMLFVAYRATDYDLNVARCSIFGGTWTINTPISSGTGNNYQPSIAANAGTVVVACSKSIGNNPRNIAYNRSLNSGDSWAGGWFWDLIEDQWDPSVTVSVSGRFAMASYDGVSNTNIRYWYAPNADPAQWTTAVLCGGHGVYNGNQSWIASTTVLPDRFACTWSQSGSYAYYALEPAGLQPPDPPTLVSPTYAQTNVPIPVQFLWITSGAATSCHIQIAIDISFSNPILDQSGLTETSFTYASLDYNTRYFWRVRAANEAGEGDWSTVSWFRTRIPPALDPPLLVSPFNNATGVPTSPTLFVWNSVTGATGYGLEADDDPLFQSPVIQQTNIVGTNFSSTVLGQGLRYYWRVYASNEYGTSDYSDIWSFATETPPAPDAPSLVAPSNGSGSVSLTPTVFVWNSIPSADSYGLQVDNDPLFGSPAINQSGLPNTNYSTYSLGSGTTYFWRANASNAGGSGPWSDIWSFTTTGAALDPLSEALPSEYGFAQIWPNPFNAATTVFFRLQKHQDVVLNVYDLSGRLVLELLKGSFPAGEHQFQWNASLLPSGLYLLKMDAGGMTQVQKAVLIK
jgi:hypothetical protein